MGRAYFVGDEVVPVLEGYCMALTGSGRQCSRKPSDRDPLYCWQHDVPGWRVFGSLVGASVPKTVEMPDEAVAEPGLEPSLVERVRSLMEENAALRQQLHEIKAALDGADV